MGRIQIDTMYKIGETVFLETDPDQLKRKVTGINIRNGGITYVVACGEIECEHYEFELSPNKDLSL